VKVVVVGSGVVGLSAAHALLEAGCDVTVCEAQAIPNRASASYDRSRMMRLQYGPQRGYAHLARRALMSWMELQRTLGVQLYRPTGVCVWSATAEAWISATSELRAMSTPDGFSTIPPLVMVSTRGKAACSWPIGW